MKKQNRTDGLRKLSFLIVLMALFSCHRALAGVVYSNTNAPQPDPERFAQTTVGTNGIEFGDEIVLSPLQGAFITNFSFEYWGENFLGDEQVGLRFYRNDGAAYGTNFNAPGTMIYDSGLSPVGATAANSLVYDNVNSGLAVWVPPSFTWAVRFTGVDGGASAGLALFTNTTVGANYDQYWEASGPGNSWVYREAAEVLSFGAQAISSGATDTVIPTIAVTSPAKKAIFRSGLLSTNITVTGTAADKISLAFVLYRFGSGNFSPATTANGYTNWTASKTLTVTTNKVTTTFEAKSLDSYGNESTLYATSYSFIASNAVTISVVQPAGTVNTTAAIASGSLLDIGSVYKLSALPDATCLFSNWLSANFTNTNTKFSFYMTPSLSITANFVTNRFFAVAGSYYGLITNTAVSHGNSGYISMKVSPKAGKPTGVSGKISVDGNSFPYSGTFNLDGTIALKKGLPIKRKVAKPDLNMTLTLLFDGTATGSVTPTNGGWTSTFTMDRSSWSSTEATAYTGLYTMVLPGNATASLGPKGDGFATINIATNGVIKMAGKLGDGTAIKQKSVVSANGAWPLFAYMFKDVNKEYQGSIMGWVDVSPNPSRTLSGELNLTKQSAAGGSYYAAGYTNGALNLVASSYDIPVAPDFVIDLTPSGTNTTGTATLSGGGLVSDLTATLFLTQAPGNKTSFGSPNPGAIKFTFKPKTGLIGGSFIHTATTLSTKIEGVVLQNVPTPVGRGFFLGSGATSGTFLLQ